MLRLTTFGLLFVGLVLSGQAADSNAIQQYARLAKVCYPVAKKETRARLCALDTGDIGGVEAVAKTGTGSLKELAEDLLEKLTQNSVSARELADHQKDLFVNVAEGLFSESNKEFAGAAVNGADAALKADAVRERIRSRQEQIDALVFERLPRIAAELSGSTKSNSLLQIHPFYRELKVTRTSPRSGKPGSSGSTGIQHFLADLRNNGPGSLHHVTVQLQMRDADDRIETYLGYWDEIAPGEIVPLCTWKIGSRHTGHYAGCAIPSGSKSHFVRYAAKIFCDEGRMELAETDFEHVRLTTDLAAFERNTTDADARKKREAAAKERAREILNAGKKPSTTPGASKPSPVTVAANDTPSPAKPAPKPETPAASEEASEDEETEKYIEDFSTGSGDDPEGWSAVQDKRPLRVERGEGKAFLTTQINVPSASQSPIITVRGDFFLEFSVLSTDRLADGVGKLDATLEGRDGVKAMNLSVTQGGRGFECGLTGSEEDSRPFPLGGKKPHKIRLERQETAYRVLVDGKVVLKHAAGDAPDYDSLKLGLANYGLRVYRIEIGPLKPAPKK